MSDSGYSSASRSTLSSARSRDLLFGEIDTSICGSAQSLRTNHSISNLILSSSSTFLRFWLVDNLREKVLQSLDSEDLPNLRLVCHEFSEKIAPRLFRTVRVQLKASSFTKPSRVEALRRVGYYTRKFEVVLPRTQEAVLPPLVNEVGEEVDFNYHPNPSPKATAFERYGSVETAELLVKQYPPTFHSATNIPSFIDALNAMPFVSHISLSCPSHEFPYGARNTVDYALISLRIAMERASLPCLDTLSFTPIHPEGLLHLQPLLGACSHPGSVRRWAQIRTMEIDMESPGDMAGVPGRKDQLKTLHNYLRNFATTLTRFRFRWQGPKGPVPLSIDSEPGVFAQSAKTHDAKSKSRKTALKFTALSHVNVENAEVDVAQISAFIDQHRRTLEEFKFESIRLRTGDWDEALLPFAKLQRKAKAKLRHEDVMECPIILSPDSKPSDTSPKDTSPPPPEVKGERSTGLQKFFAKARASRAREQLKGGSGHFRQFLRQSLAVPRR
ncbi:MAG: hypothetical protein Q9162_002944 [Coniocarpon cinnabarinum]